MQIKELLPIGSVVLLKEGQKKVMIFGIMQTDTGADNKEYDYIAVMYPEGNVGQEIQFLFNHEDIDQIFHRGYEDEEREQFLTKLDAIYKEMGAK
ncbi:MAG: DUF4176 domain-containing protein [Clostridiales bacterium]|jgi:hypothetical protein|nr:DUF4176 domain-containing protein [Clostridiales bacterium]